MLILTYLYAYIGDIPIIKIFPQNFLVKKNYLFYCTKIEHIHCEHPH